ncbi:MAG TPA: enoyl-CoA hydratase-related protein [Devosiaceae bacterium]|nr:enoyl-CoA hydratase-related protein [Devosiaceae bacterium]
MTVRFSIEDHVARIVIDRPERMNAIDGSTEARLEEIWQEIEASRSVRCVVLTGAGDKAFCAGADMKDVSKSGLEYWATPRLAGFGGIACRCTLDIPVIARVNGFALGGGFEMVLGCDIVLASENAEMGLPEARVGRMPLDGGMVRLPRKLPHNLAMEMLLTGKRVKAARLAEFGLVNEVVPPAELDAMVARWVDTILGCAPLSLRAAKQTVNRTMHLPLDEALALKLPAVMAALTSADAAEGVRAFQEKRAPIWKGC